MTELWQLALDPRTGLRALMVLLLAKVLLAVLSSIKQKQFDWRILPDFLVTDVLLYGIGLVAMWLLTLLDQVMAPVYIASVAAVTAMLLRQIWEHAQKLFGAEPP